MIAQELTQAVNSFGRGRLSRMPLHPNGANRVRRNLQQIRDNKAPQRCIIGHLTTVQLEAINEDRVQSGLPPIVAEIIFIGKHIYRSRCIRDGYSIEEVIVQIKNALDPDALFKPTHSWTVLRNPKARTIEDGRAIHDEAVFECTSRAPNPELFSVVPRGDGKNP
ncbi:MAG TPA: hypothetical protein VF865_06420 [Acidobacteriaceae bacterium]